MKYCEFWAKVLRRLRRMLTGPLYFLANRFVYERVTLARCIRQNILSFIGIKFSGKKFFADKGFRFLVPANLEFGDYISLGHDNSFWAFSKIYIGSYTQTAKDLLVVAGSHELDSFAPLYGENQEVHIGKGCWIGARVTILGGTNVGVGCIVAAGAVVKGHFPDFSIIGGVPARVIRQRIPANEIINPFGNYKLADLKGDLVGGA